jgi:hypothetical protein
MCGVLSTVLSTVRHLSSHGKGVPLVLPPSTLLWPNPTCWCHPPHPKPEGLL